MSDGIHWAPKVQRAKVRRLYETDALGIHDEVLIEDVGSALLERCRSILRVTAGEVACPRCGTVFACVCGRLEVDDVSVCPTSGCGWQTTACAYHASWRHRELLGANTLPAIAAYAERYPAARTPQARMILIDQLIHAFHWDLKAGLPNRSTANNLIEGSHNEVVAFLDQLTYGDAGTPGLADSRAAWRQTADVMMRRRRGEQPR